MADQTFEIAQALRRSHCDKRGAEHECVGQVTIKRGEICLDCPLCGKGESYPVWDAAIAMELELAFKATWVYLKSFNI